MKKSHLLKSGCDFLGGKSEKLRRPRNQFRGRIGMAGWGHPALRSRASVRVLALVAPFRFSVHLRERENGARPCGGQKRVTDTFLSRTPLRGADCHTGDIGHRFAMTGDGERRGGVTPPYGGRPRGSPLQNRRKRREDFAVEFGREGVYNSV